MLICFDSLLQWTVTLADNRQHTVFVVVRLIVETFLINREEAGEFHHLASCSQLMLTTRVAQCDGRSFKLRGGHLTRHSALEDQIIELCFIA